MTKPFKVESSDIGRLTDIQLTQLLSELLHSESYKFGIAQRSVEVALNIRVGDDGEDGRIEWENGPSQTDYLPNRLTMFQNKATHMTKSEYASEILKPTKKGAPRDVKAKVEEVMAQGGAYIVFTTQELNGKQKTDRVDEIRKLLRDLGKAYADACDIQIYDAAQISAWTNNFIPTIVSVQNWIGSPVERGLKTFQLWREHEALSSLPFVAVNSRKAIFETLSENIDKPKSCLRLMGLSGLGKTRTAFQLFQDRQELRSLVVYVDANHAPQIDALVADWVGLGLNAIVIVDNCEYRLHESLVKEVRRENSRISLLTLDYNFDSLSSNTECLKLHPMLDEELQTLLKPVYQDQLPDLDRIVAFAQGFPRMAVLLAEARLAEDPQIGELTENDLANKLLWRRNENENAETLKILQACSLFDAFGVEKEVEDQLEYLASVIGVDTDRVYECVQEYSERGLIDRRGRFGQVVPKPLAIRLAGQWWTRTREATQLQLVSGIPDEMVEVFCRQVEKMDFHTDVKQLTESLCGPQGPFGQAEVILSDRGSRLFRSFVNVNPESTSAALYQTFKNKTLSELEEIKDDTRRNLVWALERLCYHAGLFGEAAWNMLLLAAAENESWSNNATGMFSQLFRIQLSGTAAEPSARFDLVKKALDLELENVDMVLLEALQEAVEIRGGSRTIGAEYQGTKPPLREWQPRIWQEIFDYWQEAFDFLLILFDRGPKQKEKVLSTIGNSIRGFVARGRIQMLDSAINHIVHVNGRYWPSALDSIKNTFEYDSSEIKQEAEEALNKWLELLSPDDADMEERLKIIVIDPPWEHRKGPDGHYLDVAAENAREFGSEVAQAFEEFLPYLPRVMTGQQKQAFAFAHQMALELRDADVSRLIESCFDFVSSMESINSSFMMGVFRAIYETSVEQWQENIDRLMNDRELVRIYPDLLRTGQIDGAHLEKFLTLIELGLLPPQSANILSYGNITEGVDPTEISSFCLGLAEIDERAGWIAVDVIYMFCHGNWEALQDLRETLKHLTATVKFTGDSRNSASDTYRWHDLVEKLLEERDEEFAIEITNHLISSCKGEFNHGDLWSYIKPLLLKLMREYGELLWPLIGDAIVEAEGMERYWLQQLLDRETSFSNQMPSVLSQLPAEKVINWCRDNPKLGPVFVASCVNIFEKYEDQDRPSELFIALLVNFGDDQRVASALGANMGSRGWSGSLVPYLEADKSVLAPLLDHKNENVKQWVKNHIGRIDKQIEIEQKRDDERDLGLF